MDDYQRGYDAFNLGLSLSDMVKGTVAFQNGWRDAFSDWNNRRIWEPDG